MSSDIPVASGIYRITCTGNGMFYIGSALNLRKRQREHFNDLQANRHHNPKLQRAWNKYGPETFLFEVLEFVLPMALTAREQYWFNKLKPFGKRGFNIAPEAGSTLGRKHTEAACKKIGIANKGNRGPRGYKKTPEQIENHRHSLKDYKHTEEAKRNMGNSHLGTKHSLESRKKRSDTLLGHTMDPKARIAFAAHNASTATTLILTDPDGTEHLVCGVGAFCKKHGLAHSSIIEVARGKQRQHRGWTARYPETSTG